MDTAEPAIDAVQGDVIRSPFENIASGFRERDVIQPAFARARYANQRMPGLEEIAHHAIERGVPYENFLLLPPYRDAELPQRERTALAKDGESLVLSAGEAAIERRKLFEMTLQRRAKKR
jgi:hypothetical protein